MGVTGEPGQAEVLGWMARCDSPNRATEAARYFYPGVSPEQHSRLANKYRVWWQRAGKASTVPAPTSSAQGTQRQVQVQALPPRPAPRLDLARMEPLARLELQVAELGADLDLARQMGDLRTACQIDQRLSERAAELDAARAKEARVRKVPRTVGAVAAEIARKAPAIAMREAMAKRAAERAATAAEQQQQPVRDL